MSNGKTGWLVVLSGGQDSTTILARLLDMKNHNIEDIRAVTFNYGQRHDVEVVAALKIAALAGLSDRHEVVKIGDGILLGTSPLVNKENAVDVYADAGALPGGLEKTFVPMRNQLFLTIAANRAVAAFEGYDQVVLLTGVSQEDYGGYPDCRSSFIQAVELAINSALDDPSLPDIRIEAPLMTASKAQTVRIAQTTSRGFELLAYSHTCYNGETPPCGHCHACLLREKGFAEAQVEDPLVARLKAGR